ncbi:hypothetical protein K440DRAFT_644096 [Wilcoxina mikolae CBS 423.85]|nr:hypothetical protein K440DRAFT_644096 [Wilcoxina mikolae CBS 423.85]
MFNAWSFNLSESSCASYDASHPNVISGRDSSYGIIPFKSTNSCSWIDNYLGGDLTHPSNSTIVDMFHSGLSTDVYDDNLISCYNHSPNAWINLRFSDTIMGCCGPSVHATGDPDLGGVGMLTAYAFETIFTTLCVIAAIQNDVGFEYSGKFYLKKAFHIHQYCMRRTMETFLDAAIFFDLSVSVAGLGGIAWRLVVICYLMTCTLLGLIFYTRIPLQRMVGKNFKENELGFGQVLAAVMWLPVVVEYFQIAFYGDIHGLKGRLPDTYTVMRDSTNNPYRGTQDSVSQELCTEGLVGTLPSGVQYTGRS